MEALLLFIDQNIDQYLFMMILLSGIFVTKYTKAITAVPNVYKVLLIATLASVVSFYINECDKECLPKYLFTYTLATSFYEVAVKNLKGIIDKRFNKNKT